MRGKSLFALGKACRRILIDRVNEHSEGQIGEEQSVFKKGWSSKRDPFHHFLMTWSLSFAVKIQEVLQTIKDH